MSDKQDKIPSSKVSRAGRFFKTGMKVSGNYLKHYSKKAINSNTDRSELDRKNADDIFSMLTQLKGTALKIGQMLSMDMGFLPKEYSEKFKEAHYRNQALSGPLIVNTFQKYSGASPHELFDEFKSESSLAASIGQVHEAWKDGRKLAVKIQYPGVADSIHSDINMVKPVFLRAFNLKAEVVDHYLEEIVDKLMEETDYEHELENATSLAAACSGLDYLTFPKYYPELSNKKVLTMDWLDGQPLTEFIGSDAGQDQKNRVGQQLLDFMHFQLHTLKRFHADLHPGNFFIMPDGTLGVLDFGCVKKLPDEFYNNYFAMVKAGLYNNEEELRRRMYALDFLRASDDEQTDKLFYDTVMRSINMIAGPLRHDHFYFGSEEYFSELLEYGMEVKANKEFRKAKAIRGPKDAIYMHRAFFGLYTILHELNATVRMDRAFLEPITY